jgi:methionine synthase / methylenetetrahydrofolate reductase(NADPH)
MTLRDFIDDGRVHLLDGAMGTVLYAQGVFVNVCYDELNLSQPERVRRVHEMYLHAGAELIETNTFGANPVKLSAHGLEARTEEINRAAAEIAREAAGKRALVLGAVGPLGLRIEPWGPTSKDEAAALFGRQIQGLLEGGVDGLILETFADIEELKVAVAAVKAATDLPMFAHVTVGEEGNTGLGTSVEEAARALDAAGADVVGLNCSVGPATVLDGIERMADVTHRPLSALPNAGVPRAVGDRKIYLASPEYLALYARRLVEAGARFIGGCCGTTPDHIRAMREAVARLQPAPRTQVSVAERAAPAHHHDAREIPLAERSGWGAKLAGTDFLISAEVVPPRGWQTERMVAATRALQQAGVDAVTVADSPRALSRMGALPASLILQREGAGEILTHYTCRGRRMPGMISDLLGAAAAGIRNLVLITGDPPTEGPYADAEAIFDIDAIGLTNVVRRFNRGLDPGGNPLGPPTSFVIGVAANPDADDLERELDRLYWKVEAGADFVLTQPVFDAEAFARFLERAPVGGVPILAGIAPPASLRQAEFLAHEVPGIVVPESVLERMRQAQEAGGDPAAREEGVRIAREVLEAVRPLVRGVHLTSVGGGVEGVVEVVGGARVGV